MMRSAPLFAGLGALLAVSPAQALDCLAGTDEGVREHVESAHRLFRLSREYEQTPPERRDAFQISYRLVTEGDAPSPEACAVIRDADGDNEWKREAGGRLSVPTADMLTSDAMVLVRSAAGEVRVEVVFEPMDALSERMDARALIRATAQATELLKSAHGLVGLAAPGFTTVRFEWDGPAPTADAVFANGDRRPLDVIYDQAWFRPGRSGVERRAEELAFGHPPARAALAP